MLIVRAEKELLVLDDDRAYPYRRGLLVGSLVQQGLAAADAAAVAERVRGRIGERKSIEKKALLRLVKDAVRERLGERHPAPKELWEAAQRVVSVEARGRAAPFSKGVLSRSLQASGLLPHDAYDAAVALEAELLETGADKVSSEDLAGRVFDYLAAAHGAATAERYRFWRRFKHLDRPVVVLIGGGTGSGKTTLGVELAHRLDVTRLMSTDAIREILRLYAGEGETPELMHSSFDAWRSLYPGVRTPTEAQVVAGFEAQSRRVAVGVDAAIRRTIKEGANLILDGVHVVPDLLDLSPYAGDAYLALIVVGVLERERLADRFRSRQLGGGRRRAARYLESMERVWTVHRRVLGAAQDRGVPVIDNVDLERTVDAALETLRAALQAAIEARA